MTGDATSIYARMAPATVEGPWNITIVNNGQGAVSSVPSRRQRHRSRFRPDGTVEGFGGCNSFSGGYSMGASDTDRDRTAAVDDEGVRRSGRHVRAPTLTALQSSTKWTVTSGTLDLRDDGGAQQVAATTAIGH